MWGHSRGVKPDNMLIDADSSSLRLTDFGIRGYSHRHIADNGWRVDGHTGLHVSGTGAWVPATRAASLSRKPSNGGDYAKADARAATASRPALNVAPDLIVAIQQCLQQNPANRWPDAKSLRSELVPIR